MWCGVYVLLLCCCVARDSLIIPCINCGTSFLAGFVVFSVVGFMATEAGLSVDKVVTSGQHMSRACWGKGDKCLVLCVVVSTRKQIPRLITWEIVSFHRISRHACLNSSLIFSLVRSMIFSMQSPQLICDPVPQLLMNKAKIMGPFWSFIRPLGRELVPGLNGLCSSAQYFPDAIKTLKYLRKAAPDIKYIPASKVLNGGQYWVFGASF